MWRPAHGATSRPGPSRPASGYGRALGRPGPQADGPLSEEQLVSRLEPSVFRELVADLEVEASAPVTP
jgi:hypothetical protein